VSQNNKNLNRFDVYEEFTSQEAFKAHQQRLTGTEWGELSLKLVDVYE